MRIRHLQAFRDNDGFLRVKTKIILREDTYDFRCPFVLPTVNDLLNLIIKECLKRKILDNRGQEND